MAKQSIDIQQSAGENASRMNTNFGELYDGASALSQRVADLEQGTIPSGESDLPIYGTREKLNVVWVSGYLDASGNAITGSEAYGTRVTEPIDINGYSGKYLFLPGYYKKGDNSFTFAKYANSEVLSVDQGHLWGKNFLVVPITGNEESVRISMKKAPYTSGDVYLVDREWLIDAGYANYWAGKAWIGFGDSYIGGYGLGSPYYTWHNRFSCEHVCNYTNKGHNGIGLVRAKSVGWNLIDMLTSDLLDGEGNPLDVDAICVTIGRNDYSAGVAIGAIDDMADPTQQYWASQTTFMGGLNYLCKWLIEHYLGKRIFFITPWYFLDNMENTIADPVEYVNAMLTVTGKWGIPCFDAARQSGINVQSEAFRTQYFASSNDTSHLNIEGHKLMAHGPVCGWLENLFRE